MQLLATSGVNLNLKDNNNLSTFDYFLYKFQELINGTKKETLINFFNFLDDNINLNVKNSPPFFILKNFHISFEQDAFGLDLLLKMKNLDLYQLDSNGNNFLHNIMNNGNHSLAKYFKKNHKI